MALIKCPECGRENVSDSAEMCPGCGYGIKAYFEKIRKEEERKEQARKAEEAKRKAEIQSKQGEEERIRSVLQPEKPIFSRGFIVYMIIAIIFFSWLMLYTPTTYSDPPHVGEWIFEIILFVGVPFGVYFLNFSKRIERYNLAQSNFEEYQKQVIKEQDAAIASAQAAAVARAREEAMKPECPYCHSHNTSKITATAKAVNTAMFGVLGQKRKYQWHCNNCKSDF